MKNTIDRSALLAPIKAAEAAVEAAQSALESAESAVSASAVDDGSDPLEIVKRRQDAASLVEVRKIELARAEQNLRYAKGDAGEAIRTEAGRLATLLKAAADKRSAEIMDALRELAGDDHQFGILKSECRLEYFPKHAKGVHDRRAKAYLMDRFSSSINCSIEDAITEIERAQALL